MSPFPNRPESGQAAPFAAARPAALRAAARTRLLRWAGFAPAAFFLVCILLPPLNHDVAAVLDFSRRWLAGERLYVDLVDVNPPLIYLLNLVPAALARWTILTPVQALLLCLVGYAVLLWRMTEALRVGRVEGAVEAAVLTTTIPLLLVVAGSDFGQRDVMMGMAAVPYALLAARRMEGPPVPWRLALGVTVVAALAFALKPYFLAVPLLVEAAVLRRRGLRHWRRDPIPWAMGMVWLAYLLVVLIAFPVFWEQVLPFAWQVYGRIHGPGFWGVLGTDVMGAAALLMLAMPAALRRQSGAFAQALAAAALGAFLSAWAQHKGWTYHVMPVTILGCGAVVVAAARWADRSLPAVRAQATAPMLAALAAFGVMLYAVRGGETPWRQTAFHGETPGRLADWLQQHAHGADVLALSPDLFPLQPALTYAEAHQHLHAMSIWLLQGAYRTCPDGPEPYREPHQMGAVEFAFYHRTAEEFALSPPRALVVTRHANIPACGDRFDLLQYFLRHPLFAEAFLRYQPAGEIDGHRLFLRQD
ncbi:hypothetical protein KPL78_07790 [Roseomonas sp. HJA6]|uniref:Glycosyltransferase RgtA/B/C/D-like domain-containing protein n=1 Tax=Roseomonas alba TaxID=2846776 RepID=A0ABS7A609_9PROT|nr:hypothetical protein [Neoroseomonas alba]MBW6397739.1 hypothetical protein [Neoroseomonas alba]